ncbi:uncharacterized protein AB675_2535 [Cyphellophora attinorum]|uniref:Uncharacterized protein n=1 Tax=Cyphellophora attinorum TaxID=1664694 RepID=A0A0N1P290_9EURO|nr:uncharacterized protein AB675_2535 [Phialophora attinorum]KPI44867.1 hypothetical protein AB675_2535 [Phialophora attinorum]
MAIHQHRRRQDVGSRIDNPDITGSIPRPSLDTSIDGDIVTASAVETFTTATGVFAITSTVNGQPTTILSTGEIPITDGAQYTSILSSESASRAAANASKTAATSSSPSESSSGGGANLGTLIPAIVVPVVVVLLASFGGFWFWMRRRHRKELQNTDFAMAGKGEKLNSRSNSSRSGPPTATAAEKATADVKVTELSLPQTMADSGPRDSYEAIGMARADDYDRRQNDPRTRSPNMPFSGTGDHGQQNFSGPRPNTAKNRPPPSRGEHQSRNRSNSSPGNRGPPPSGYRGPRGPPPPQDIGPSPIMRNHASPSMGSGPMRGPPPHSQPRAAPTPPGPGKMRAPSPTMGINRSNAPPALSQPPPGAFNGASPISQYSPIVKDTPNIGAVATFGGSPPKISHSRDGSNKPPPINTSALDPQAAGLGLAAVALTKDKSRSPSPRSPEESFLTEENMRIARLANSSRLGFNTSKPTSPGPNNLTHSQPQQATTTTRDFSKPLGFKKSGQDSPRGGMSSPLMPLNTAHSAPGQSPAATSTTNPSPKLPPPATYSQLIPSDSPRDEKKPQWNYFGNLPSNINSNTDSPTSSVYSGLPHTRPLPASRNGPISRSDDRDDDQKSEISDLAEYEDIDAKSDVSSLNEFERFDFDSQRGSRGSDSVGGVGSRLR